MEKRRQSILKSDGRIPFQEMLLPDDDTSTVTVTKSRRVSFGANFVKEYLVGSAISTHFCSEYEQAFSSSDSSNPNSSRSGLLDQSTFNNENNVLDLCIKPIVPDEYEPLRKKLHLEKSQNAYHGMGDKKNDKHWEFNIENTSDIFSENNPYITAKQESLKNNIKSSKKVNNLNGTYLESDRQFQNKKNETDFDCSKINEHGEKKTKVGKFSSTICFSADSPTADMEFTEGCITLAKNILEKKQKEMTVYIQAKAKESRKEVIDGSNLLFEGTEVEMSLTRCVNNSFDDSDSVNETDFLKVKRGVDANDDLDTSEESTRNVPVHSTLNPILDHDDQDESDLERSVFFPERSLSEFLKCDSFKTTNSEDLSLDEDDNEECDMELSSCESFNILTSNESVGKENEKKQTSGSENMPITHEFVGVEESENLSFMNPSECDPFRNVDNEIPLNESDDKENIVPSDSTSGNLVEDLYYSQSKLDLLRCHSKDKSVNDEPCVNEGDCVEENVQNMSTFVGVVGKPSFNGNLREEGSAPLKLTVEEHFSIDENKSPPAVDITLCSPSNTSMGNEPSHTGRIHTTESAENMAVSDESIVINKNCLLEYTSPGKIEHLKSINSKQVESEVNGLMEETNLSVPTQSQKPIPSLCEQSNPDVLSLLQNKETCSSIEKPKCSEALTLDLKESVALCPVNENNSREEVNLNEGAESQKRSSIFEQSNAEISSIPQNMETCSPTKEPECSEAMTLDQMKSLAICTVKENILEMKTNPNEEVESQKSPSILEQSNAEITNLPQNIETCSPMDEPKCSTNKTLPLDQIESVALHPVNENNLRVEVNLNEGAESQKRSSLCEQSNAEISSLPQNMEKSSPAEEIECSEAMALDQMKSVAICTIEENNLGLEVNPTEEAESQKSSSLCELSNLSQNLEMHPFLEQSEYPKGMTSELVESVADTPVEEPKSSQTFTLNESIQSQKQRMSGLENSDTEMSSHSEHFEQSAMFEETRFNQIPDTNHSETTGDCPSLGDEKVSDLIIEQSEEPNCFWKIENISNTVGTNVWSFSFPLMDSSVIIKFKLKPPKENSLISFSHILDRTIELHKSKTYKSKMYQSWTNNCVDFAFEKIKHRFEYESSSLDNSHKIPLFLDKINLWLRKINGIIGQLMRILTEYPGSQLNGSILSFRLYSFPLMFSYMISVNISDPFELSKCSISLEKHFGRLNKDRIKCTFNDCLKKEEVLIQFIRNLMQEVINKERVTGSITNRSHIELIE